MIRATSPLWAETLPGEQFPALAGDLACDVAIVGAGITGLTAALLLTQAGKRVVVIDSHRVAGGNSGRTTAHLTTALDAGWSKILTSLGKERARRVALSQRAALEKIASIVEALEIHCDFHRVPGWLYTERKRDRDVIEREHAAAFELGLEVTLTGEAPLPFAVEPLALRYEGQARFHPRAYLLGLAEEITAAGSRVFEGVHADDVVEGEPCRVVTERGAISAGHVIVATHSPITSRFVVPIEVAPYRTYVLAISPNAVRPIPDGLYWDTDQPYHYLRLQDDLLIVGGEDHKVGKGEEAEHLSRLAQYCRARFVGHEIRHAWSGQVLEPADGLPLIGKSPGAERVLIASGYSGQGMTNGTLAAMITSDIALGEVNRWSELFDSRRITPRASAKNLITENVGFPLHLIGDRLRRAEAIAEVELAPGEGRIVEVEGEKVAAFRDREGRVTLRSAVCTHMGCLVRWNSAEESWDCPCHGSRFDTKGCVVDGPARAALSPVDDRRLAPDLPKPLAGLAFLRRRFGF